MEKFLFHKSKLIILSLFLMISAGILSQESVSKNEAVDHFLILLTSNNPDLLDKSIDYVENQWEASFEAIMIETIYFSLRRAVVEDYIELLQNKTGQTHGRDMDAWYQWLWNKPPTYNTDYFEFRSRLHSLIDPKFGTYFSDRENQTFIRLDEVMWGGVKQDGIPPLRNPEMISARAAEYLDDDNIVFGIEINGDARAYPKRILAWHEMFTDTVGGLPVAGVYCTLCGTFIVYETRINKKNYNLGTSGFLYRSNKLMYDKATQSLWSTLEGEPVIGPLVNKGIRLNYQSAVTTTWGAWKALHPDTSVLSNQTGFNRDYGEGVAYREYFSTDELMFQVPQVDSRLQNKDEILAIRIPEKTDKSLAIASGFLKSNPIFQTELDDIPLVVFTDKSGAHRVYQLSGQSFAEYDGKCMSIDSQGGKWSIKENELISASGKKLKRIHSFNAFWFGWQAAFPDTGLIDY